MTRRSQVVRSSSRTGPGAYRDLSSTIIHCFAGQYAGPGLAILPLSTSRTIGEIAIEARDPYQRFFASATVDDVQAWWPDNNVPDTAVLRLVADDSQEFCLARSGPAQVPNEGQYRDLRPVALSSAIDLAAGPHTIGVELYPYNYGNDVSYSSIRLSVIEGQVVMQPSCNGGGGDE